MLEQNQYEIKPGKVASIALSVSPAGKECVLMVFDNKQWILVASMKDRDAFEQGLYFHQLGIESRQGPPFDWRKSIAAKKLARFGEEDMKDGKIVGVYISSEKFDYFIDHSIQVSSTLSDEGTR